MNDYLTNGVKARKDGQGDLWAAQHREALGPGFNMQDMDGFFGQVAFAANTGDKLFLEYVPDDYVNRVKFFRRFAVVAFFDRKSTMDWAMNERNRVSMAFYMWICRMIGEHQPIPCRFFIVTGGEGRWMMSELNTADGQVIGESRIEGMNWKAIWQTTGLTTAREQLRKWVQEGQS